MKIRWGFCIKVFVIVGSYMFALVWGIALLPTLDLVNRICFLTLYMICCTVGGVALNSYPQDKEGENNGI